MTETVVTVALVRFLVFAVGKMMHCEFKQCAIVIATGRTTVKPQLLTQKRYSLVVLVLLILLWMYWSVPSFIGLSRLGSRRKALVAWVNRILHCEFQEVARTHCRKTSGFCVCRHTKSNYGQRHHPFTRISFYLECLIFVWTFSNGPSDGVLQFPFIITNDISECIRVHQWELKKKRKRKRKGGGKAICFELNLSLKFAWQFPQFIWPFPWHKKNSVMVERQWA